ncbi:VPA1262 family protein [Vibrio parahaemolyticus]
MINYLNTLFADFRLYSLFGDDDNFTVTQLWVLEIERESSSELRFLYARTLPSTYQSDTWQGSVSTKTQLYNNCSVKTHTLTLHTSTKKLTVFLEHFINGAPLQKASQLAEVNISDKLANTVGVNTFGESPLIRSVMHLPTRDYYQFQTSRLSPTSYCSVDSGAISPEDKPKIFSVPEGCDMMIAEAACQALDADTGLDFSKTDSWRISDFEFICAPGLNAAERCKYDISLKGKQSSLTLFESLTREPSDLLVIIKAYSEGSIQSSYITNLSKSSSYPLHHQFELKVFQNQSSTAYTMEIYALGPNGEHSSLLLQTGNHFMRQMNYNLQLVEPIRAYEQFSWLDKKVPKREKVKLEAAKQVGRAIRPSRSQMSDYTADPWVPLNRLIQDRVRQLCPNKSDGRFFPTLNNSNGMSRLELKDWLKSIFEQHHDAKIAWIDPYMEDVGIELLNRLGTASADYLIITTEKTSNDDSTKESGQPTRVDNLLARCSGWNNGYFGSVHLKVLAVPESKLHDRMILIRSANGQPLSGYHLSNSVQRASENHPLLVTPIPLDVVPHVFEYVDQIIQNTLHRDDKTPPPARIIFNSTDIKPRDEEKPKGLSHNSSFAEPQCAGSVIAWWLDDEQLSDFSGSELMEKMSTKGYVKDGQLDPEHFDALPAKFWKEGLPMADFHSAWDALGCVIANSPANRYTGSLYNKEQSVLSEQVKLALLEHISPSRANALQPRLTNKQLDIEHYRSQGLIELLLSKCDPFSTFTYSPVDTSYSDYFSIQLLWSEAPKQFVSWLNTILSKPIKQPRSHALVVEALKHICLVVSFDKHQEQIDALLQSNVSVITWIGLHALAKNINGGDWGIEALSKIEHITPSAVRRTIQCWLINEANYFNSDIKPQLIASLTQSLEAPLKDNELKDILLPVRNHNGRLHHFKPWILESMLVPMLEQRIIDITQVAHQWLTELINQWQTALKNNRLDFMLETDGAFTDELAVLTKYLSPDVREKIFSKLQKVFNTLARTIRRPMSAQISWNSYSNAHRVNLWLYAFANRMAELLPDKPSPLNELLLESKEIIERISPSTWDIFSINKLSIYAMDDPKHIRSHNLHQIIKNTLTTH